MTDQKHNLPSVAPNVISFFADKVKVKTGRIDNSGIVEFEVGEYELKNIAQLVTVTDCVLKVTVEMEEE